MTSPDTSTIVQAIERVLDNYKMTKENPRQSDPSAPPFDIEPCNPILDPYDESADYKEIPLSSNWNTTTLDMSTIPIPLPITEATIIESGLDETNIYHPNASSHLLHFIHHFFTMNITVIGHS